MKLYSYFRSSAAYRVRIALNLKELPYEMAPIHLTKDGGRQHTPEFRAINPQARVPALELSSGEILTQSLAAGEMPKLDGHQLAALTLAVQQARLAIAERRSELTLRPSSPPSNILSLR